MREYLEQVETNNELRAIFHVCFSRECKLHVGGKRTNNKKPVRARLWFSQIYIYIHIIHSKDPVSESLEKVDFRALSLFCSCCVSAYAQLDPICCFLKRKTSAA